jgi:hypothetical protein
MQRLWVRKMTGMSEGRRKTNLVKLGTFHSNCGKWWEAIGGICRWRRYDLISTLERSLCWLGTGWLEGGIGRPIRGCNSWSEEKLLLTELGWQQWKCWELVGVGIYFKDRADGTCLQNGYKVCGRVLAIKDNLPVIDTHGWETLLVYRHFYVCVCICI